MHRLLTENLEKFETTYIPKSGGATPEVLCSQICFCIGIHMPFKHYNSIPGQWLDTCQAAAGPGRAAAGPGQAARLLRGKNPEVQRLLRNVTPRSGWQRCLSNYTVSLFFRCSKLFCNCVASSMFPTFPFCVVHFLVVRFVQRFLSYQAAQGL